MANDDEAERRRRRSALELLTPEERQRIITELQHRLGPALQQQIELRISETRSSSYSGPIPPPEMLSEYNKAFPGCAERIVAMAEGQARHRHGLERSALDTNRSLAR